MNSETTRDFSSKYGLLDDVAKTRYVEKLDLIAKGAKDPNCVSVDMQSESLSNLLPLVEFGDLYHYLITALSPATKNELEAWKSMDGRTYNILSGWVGDVSAYLATTDERVVW